LITHLINREFNNFGNLQKIEFQISARLRSPGCSGFGFKFRI
jgi:hypothetical protein